MTRGWWDTYENKPLEVAALQPEAHDSALLPQDERSKLRDGLPIHVVSINLVQHIAHIDQAALFCRPTNG